MATKPLEEMGKFATVVIDPPWQVEFGIRRDSGLEVPYSTLGYDTMSIEDIIAIPVRSTLADDAFLFIWTTNKFLSSTFDILKQWGAKYSFTMVWHKPGGPKPIGGPVINTEFTLVGRKGHPAVLDDRAFRTGNYWPRGAHSEKPEGFYELLRRVTPGPRLDIFGRRRIAGFESWGNEAPEGPALPDHYQQVLLDA